MMIGGAGAAYDDGIIGNIADPFGAALCLFLLALFFVRLIRRLKLLTFIQFVEQRYGPTAATITSIASLMSTVLWVAGMLVAFGIVFETLTGTPLVYGILGGAVIVIIYTTMGGMLAVALTDFFQMIVIAIGLIVLLVDKLLTFIQFVEQRYGPTAATITSIASLMSTVLWVAGMLVAFGIVFETLTGTPLVYGILGGAVIVIIYTTMGGMLAVALTDFFQMIVIAIGLIVLLVVVLVDSGGWGTISSQLPEHTFRMYPLEHTGEQWLNYLRAWVIFGLADIASQSLMGRALAAKSERVAQQSFYLASIGYLAFGMIPVLLGIIGSVTMPGLGDSESIVPALAFAHLHPVASAVFVGAVLAAIMSSCDSALLASASVASTNLLPLVKQRRCQPRHNSHRHCCQRTGAIGLLPPDAKNKRNDYSGQQQQIAVQHRVENNLRIQCECDSDNAKHQNSPARWQQCRWELCRG